MKVLLTFEYRKLFRQKSFYVCGILLLAFVFFSAAVSRLAADNAQEIAAPLPTAIGMLRTALQGANATPIIGIFAAFVCVWGSCGRHAEKHLCERVHANICIFFEVDRRVLCVRHLLLRDMVRSFYSGQNLL